LQIEFTASGVDGELGPGNSLLIGGIEFDTPEGTAAPRSAAGSVFPFYLDAGQAEHASSGRAVSYDALFRNAGGGLRAGTPLYLAGFPIGRIVHSRLAVDPHGSAVSGAIAVEIEPESLGLSPDGNDADRRRRTDQLLLGLIRHGFRLEMAQSPPLLGPAILELRQSPETSISPGSPHEPLTTLPTMEATSLNGLTERADRLLARLDAVPIEQIGQNVRSLTSRLSGLAASPEIRDGLKHLDRTLTELDQITSTAQPKIGPLVDKLSATADQLSALARSANRTVGGADGPQDATLPDAIRQLAQAARSIRTLADDLDRHPESLLEGRKPRR